MKIVQAEMTHLDILADLFDEYRKIVLGVDSNVPASRHFIFERLLNHEAVIYLALNDQDKSEHHSILGFITLYPGFSSQKLQTLWRVQDLYVKPNARRQRVGQQLIRQACQLASERHDLGLVLELPRLTEESKAFIESLRCFEELSTTQFASTSC